jgi:DNA invertase Pin-like site-specific DNA recombinase
MGEYNIYKYIRLSLDDAQTDSMSIENQRLILNRYVADLDIPGANVVEIVDNGYSGTNYERPGVQELLELVRAGKVNCIIVKDFSRFGRNAIETGYFIERVFPLFRVRFISVSDNFDSAEHEGDTGGMEVAFKFLMHEYYSRDLSKKIKSSRQAKMRRGEYVVKSCLFGYKLNDKRQYEIDEPAAGTIRHIFQMYADGVSIADIQRGLYEEKRPTPAEYKKRTNAAINTAENLTCVWDKPQIMKILTDERYVGTYIAGKHKNKEVGSKQTQCVDKSDWYRIPDHHPAIVGAALFEAVQSRIAVKPEPQRRRKLGTSERYADIKSVLSGKVTCGCCGHNMRQSATRNSAFHCHFTRTVTDAKCHGLKILASDVETVLFEIISKRARVILNADLSDFSGVDAKREQQSEYEQRLVSLSDEKRGLYEQLILGKINRDEYKTAKATLDAQTDRINGSFSQLKDENAVSSALRAAGAENKRTANQILGENRLTKPLVDLLIDKIFIFPDNRIEIKWKVADFPNNTQEGLTNA